MLRLLLCTLLLLIYGSFAQQENCQKIVDILSCDSNADSEFIVHFLKTNNFNSSDIHRFDCMNCNLNLLTKQFLNIFENLEKLSIIESHVNKIEPFVFKSLKKLEYVTLFGNQIDKIESDAFISSSITELDLRNNKISNLYKNIFDGLERIIQLNLSNNHIKTIESHTFPNTLETLILTNNKIERIKSYAFCTKNCTWTNLKSLQLLQNRIRQIDDDAFINLTQLEMLNLNRMNLITINQNTFRGLKNLRHLYMLGNNITEVHKNAFDHLTNLEKLDLDDNPNLKLKPNVFKNLNLLTILKLPKHVYKNLQPGLFKGLESINDINLKGIGIKELVANDFAGLISLEKLNLANNQLTILEPNTFCNLQSLISLNLLENPLKEYKAFAFSCLDSLRELQLPLQRTALKIIHSYTFYGLKDLRILNLTQQGITKIESLGFYGLNSLQILDLSDNQITHILENSFVLTLRILYLQNNHIKALPNNIFQDLYALQYLNMSNNRLSYVDYILKPAVNLNVVDISNNNIDNIEIEKLVCHNNKQLHRIFLENNKWQCKRLEEMLWNLQHLEINFTPKHLNMYVKNINGIICNPSTIAESSIINKTINFTSIMTKQEFCDESYPNSNIIDTIATIASIEIEETLANKYDISYITKQLSWPVVISMVLFGVLMGCVLGLMYRLWWTPSDQQSILRRKRSIKVK